MGRPGKLGDASATKYNKEGETKFKGYQVGEMIRKAEATNRH